jgi:hypothetical protein
LTTNNSAVTLDFYIAGKDFNYEKYMNSIYSFSMFYSMDYLNANKGFPLYKSLIMQPIESFDINGYKLFIRTTKSENIGNPYFIFYSNNNFYDAFLNRDLMYAYEDGSVSEAINMKNKEKEMNSFDKNEKKANYSNQEANSILISQKVK